MHVTPFIHKILRPVMHFKRLSTLSVAVDAAARHKRLSLTNLGRSLDLPIQERSCIRKMDRFLSNYGLYTERSNIYRVIASFLIGSKLRPWIIVDWSPAPNTTHNVLRAALVCEGRALSIYEEVHPACKLGNKQVHKRFMKQVKSFLPKECKPIVITDAGFHSPWFSMIKELGWDYVGRIRACVKYRYDKQETWNSLSQAYQLASLKPTYLGKIRLSKQCPIDTALFVVKSKPYGRMAKNKLGLRRGSKDSQKYSKANKDPWALVSSIGGFNAASKVIKIYSTRMQIEEGFRDLKSSQYGFGLEKARSKSVERIQILLLIGMLASLIAWLTGWASEKLGLQRQFQANSVKKKRVLSLFFLGCQVIRRKIKITYKQLTEAIEHINHSQTYNV